MPIRKYATTTEAEILRHLAQGLTIAEVAKELNVSPRMLHHCVSVLGLKSTGRGNRKARLGIANNPFGIQTGASNE